MANLRRNERKFTRCTWETLCPDGWHRCSVTADQDKHQRPDQQHWFGAGYRMSTATLEGLSEDGSTLVRRTPVLPSSEASEEEDDGATGVAGGDTATEPT